MEDISRLVKVLREKLSIFFCRVRKNIYLSAFFVFVFFAFVNSFVYFTVANVSSNDDQWFYTKMAYLLRTQGFEAATGFQGAYFTDLVQEGYGYGVGLYHYLLIPFTFFSNEIFGLKLSGLFFASLVPALIYWVVRRFDFKYAFFWVVIFFYALVSQVFLFRLFLNRPFVLIDALVLLQIYLISKGKHWAFFWVSLLNTWWHPATFWLPVFLAACFEVARIMHKKKISYRTVMTGFIGSMSAFLLFPPHSHTFLSPLNPVYFIKTLFSFIYGLNDNLGIVEGVENLKGDVLQFSSQNTVLFIFLITFIILSVFSYLKRRNEGSDTDKNEDRSILRDYAFILTIIFFLGYTFSMRFEDLLLPIIFLDILILFAMISDNGYIKIEDPQIKKVFVYSLLVLFIFFGTNKILNLRSNFGNTENYLGYKRASEWIMQNTQEGEIIFNTDFGQFNRLFFYNSRNRYIVGLEPKSFYRHDEKKYWLWQNITRTGVAYDKGDYSVEFNKLIEGKKEEQLGEFMLGNAQNIAHIIKNEFDSNYIFFEGDSFLRRELEKDPADFTLAYYDSDRGIYIYKVN